MAKLGHPRAAQTVTEANFQPVALMIYVRHDLAVKNKHSLHDMKRMFVLYGGVVPCVCDQREWLEVGLQESPVLPDGPTSPLISGLTI